MINPLLSSKLNRNNGRKHTMQVTHLFVKRIRVSNACNTDFRLFIVLRDELLIASCIYFALYLGHAER